MFYIFRNGLVSSIDSRSHISGKLGTKATRCAELHLNGFNIPPTLILPAIVLDDYISKLGITEQNSSLSEELDAVTFSNDFELIRQKIQDSRLDRRLLNSIEEFADSLTNSVSVRSSALAEDTDTWTSAGQFQTVINCRTLQEIENAILHCWSSLWVPHAFKTLSRFQNREWLKMGIMLMETVSAISSGVVFTRNPLTGADEIVVEAIWGLGEGLVSKGLTPDRYIFDPIQSSIAVDISNQETMYIPSIDRYGTEQTQIDPAKKNQPVLSNQQAINLVNQAREIEQFFKTPQDIEWALDSNDQFWLLQSRDITSISTRLPSFSPPDVGTWRIVDHIASPGTRCFSEYYYEPMETGWNEEALEIGTLNRVKIREVNGFMYYQMGMVQSEQEFLEMCEKNEGYWEEKRYLDALEHWDQFVKPQAVHRLTKLQRVMLDELSDTELVDHLSSCFNITKKMVKGHHSFTYTSFIPIGDFIVQLCKLTKKEPVDILGILAGSAQDRLFLEGDAPELMDFFRYLQKNTVAIYLLTRVEIEPENAHDFLQQFMSVDENFRKGMQYILDSFGYRIISGYDISSETYIERPDILLKSINSVLHKKLLKKKEVASNEIWNLIPEDKEFLFREMLLDVRQMDRLRDERGVYSDLWAIGILRHAYLEAGRRLTERGGMKSQKIVLDASIQEIVSLIEGIPTISEDELERRCIYRSSFTVTDVPTTLGPSNTSPPDLSILPSSIARTMAGLITSVTLAVDHVHQEIESEDVLVGVPASRGVVDGTAKVINSDAQINEINRGDILIVYQTTAAYNAVFPIVSGIISQFGGILSHPAILAREHEIPCIVGCSGAMKKIQTGMRIRLDGNNGQVKIISNHSEILQSVAKLKCEYTGPMRGRNRNRVFNHLALVSDRLKIIEKVRQTENYLDILQRHFYHEIDTDTAVEQIIHCSQNDLETKNLATFIQRHHIEFHPCDACNLHCSGCTYFQDQNSGPNPISIPIDSMERISSMIQPKAVTVVGGGEPALYNSKKNKLGDLICALGKGDYGCTPAIGVISNGTIWIPGDKDWHHYVNWIRYSLDMSTAESYLRGKGKDYFDIVVGNVLRTLMETKIPQVSIGYLYHPGTIVEAGNLISKFERLISEKCPDQIHRFSIQFRPWRNPTGRPSINERILSQRDIEGTALDLFRRIKQNPALEKFVRQNTNIAVNLLCGGARENVMPFSQCYFGLAKTVIRASGDLYPCFRMAASEDRKFLCGNILMDQPLKIALNELYIHTYSSKSICQNDHEKCLFCVFNNMIEEGLDNNPEMQEEAVGEYFF